MELVAKGSQDIFLTGNPSVSYFRNVYKRHTNFSCESIQQSIIGDPDFKKTVECIISRAGDLLTGIIIEIDLPKLEGKRNKIVSWINSIGHYILEKIELQIGGNVIDTHYGEWLEIWNELTIRESHKKGYYNMIGKDITITNKKTLLIPLQFWFCRNYGLALPLIALQYHEVKLIITLADFNKCWKKEYDFYYLKRSGNKVTVQTPPSTDISINDIVTSFPESVKEDGGEDIYFDMKILWVDNKETNLVKNRKISDETSLVLKTTYTTEKTGYAYLLKNEPIKDTYKIGDMRIYCDYIFLDTGERKHFAQKKHIYLIEQLQLNEGNEYSKGQESNKISLDFNHPCKEIIWVNNLLFNNELNQHFNYSDRIQQVNRENPIDNVILFINGQERFSKRNADYFRLLVPLQKHSRIPDNFIYNYCFSIKPEDNQPSGSCNFSRINTADIIINYKSNMDDLTTKIYSVNYNILNIINGMGGVAYSN